MARVARVVVAGVVGETAGTATAVAVPSVVAPSMNVTVPVAVTGVIVAVRVIVVPNEAGEARSAVRTVVVGIAPTETFTLAVELATFASPPYVADSTCGPNARPLVVSAAVPPATTTGAPSAVEPSLNVTEVPAGVPAVAGVVVTVAVNVTG